MADHDYPSEFDPDQNPTWRIFKIMSEFVDGFTFLAGMPKSVTFFGSARLAEDHPFTLQARELAQRLADRGYTIVTGGGPGIMEAANHGACDANGDSVGLNIQLPNEQRMNPYVRRSMSFNYFFSRKVMLQFSADAYIFFPGGFGTLDEFFELITLVQTGKHDRATPVILMGRSYWEPLTKWISSELVSRLHTVAKSDVHIWTLTDDIEEALHLVETGVAKETATKGPRKRSADERLKRATRPMHPTEQ
jgi:uncharacterized protein (TIGR00730 family)